MPHRLRLPAALAAALIVAEAAFLLLRPKQKYLVAPAEPRDYFSVGELERATSFRDGRLAVDRRGFSCTVGRLRGFFSSSSTISTIDNVDEPTNTPCRTLLTGRSERLLGACQAPTLR